MSLIKTSAALAQLDNFLNLWAERSDRETVKVFGDHVHRLIGIQHQFPQDHILASKSPGSNLSQMSFVSYNDWSIAGLQLVLMGKFSQNFILETRLMCSCDNFWLPQSLVLTAFETKKSSNIEKIPISR